MKLHIQPRTPGILRLGDDPTQCLRQPVIYLVVPGARPSPLANVAGFFDIQQRLGTMQNVGLPNDFRDIRTDAQFEEFGLLNAFAATKMCLNNGVRLRLLVVPSDSTFLRLPFGESMAAMSNRLGRDIRKYFTTDYLAWSREHETHLKQYDFVAGDAHLRVKDVFNALQDFPLEAIVETGIGMPSYGGLNGIENVTFAPMDNITVGAMIQYVRMALDNLDNNMCAPGADYAYLGERKITINLIRSFATTNGDQVVDTKNEEAAKDEQQSQSEG